VAAEASSYMEQGSDAGASIASQPFGEFGQDSFAELGPVIYSILVADVGSSFTRVSLLERVETGFSFVAHGMATTTAEPPWSDVSVGVRHAIGQITDTTKRQLLDDNGTLTIPEARGKGIDLLVVTCSAAQPLRVVLAGLVGQVSLASLERAATSSHADVLGVIARDYIGPTPSARLAYDRDGDGESEADQDGAGLSDEDKVALIRQKHPDVVWVAGGTDGGSSDPVRDLVETIALGCTLVDGPPRPAIVYAGNADLRSEIVDLIGEEVELEVIDNVRPTLDTENLAAARVAFQAAYVQRKIQRLPGIGSLIGWSSAPLLATSQALEYLVLYLERLYESGKGVLCADVGSATTTVATSLPVRLDRATSEDGGQRALQVATDMGVGYSAPKLLERVGVQAIAQWLPFEPEPGEVEGLLLNKGLRPTTVPEDRRQLLIEQAAAREALRLVMRRARESWRGGAQHSQRWMMPLLEPIIATGGVLTQAPRPSQTALMLLDAIEPVGITTLLLDEYGLASVLGAVAVTHPLAAVQALDAGPFLTLGTVVAPLGRARFGDVIMRVKISFEQGGELEIEAKYGSLEMVPLRTGEKALMELKPRRGFRVGRTGGPVEVHGGAVGLVIDARGRPLRLPPNEERCRQLIQQWLWEMGA
jgi:uncharacterized protein (TIGR01319 family)